MFFSIIIPCYNSHKTIGRLLDSICKQLVALDSEVIVVNDGNDDGYLDIVSKYSRRLNIKVVNTPTDSVHCPSNSRRAGLAVASGEWVCFSDHDDAFISHKLPLVRKYIRKHDVKKVLWTNFISLGENGEKEMHYIQKSAWLHGKFYNRKWLEECGITFKKDLKTHEDIYFNCCVLNALFKAEETPTIYNIDTHYWIYSDTSITRSYAGEMGYLHDNFADYITCATNPFIADAVEGNELAEYEVLMCLLHCYFYYEGGLYNFGADKMASNLADIRRFYNAARTALGWTEESTVKRILDDPVAYNFVRSECAIAEGAYIEEHNFKAFIDLMRA